MIRIRLDHIEFLGFRLSWCGHCGMVKFAKIDRSDPNDRKIWGE